MFDAKLKQSASRFGRATADRDVIGASVCVLHFCSAFFEVGESRVNRLYQGRGVAVDLYVRLSFAQLRQDRGHAVRTFQ